MLIRSTPAFVKFCCALWNVNSSIERAFLFILGHLEFCFYTVPPEYWSIMIHYDHRLVKRFETWTLFYAISFSDGNGEFTLKPGNGSVRW